MCMRSIISSLLLRQRHSYLDLDLLLWELCINQKERMLFLQKREQEKRKLHIMKVCGPIGGISNSADNLAIGMDRELAHLVRSSQSERLSSSSFRIGSELQKL